MTVHPEALLESQWGSEKGQVHKTELSIQERECIVKPSARHPTSAPNCQANGSEDPGRERVGTSETDCLRTLKLSRLIFMSAPTSGAVGSIPELRDQALGEK